MRVLIFLLALILSSAIISALCEEGQININSASAVELDKITQVGPATAEEIIKNRPFSSLDELIDVRYIGDTKLALIKEEGLACVDEEDAADSGGEEEEQDEKNSTDVNETTSVSFVKTENSSPKNIELETINLNPQAIKSVGDSEISDMRDYAVYGLLAFGVLLGALFLIKNIVKRNRYKNEFT